MNFPMSREKLQRLKTEADEYKRVARVNRIVKYVSSKVIEYAVVGVETTFTYVIPSTSYHLKFISENLDAIMDALTRNFPDCLVDNLMSVKDFNGTEYNVFDFTEADMPPLETTNSMVAIVIDWT